MIPFAQICLFSSFLILIVGVMLYDRNPTRGINRMFVVLSGVLFYWGFTQFEFLQASDAEAALFWMRLGAFWYLVPAIVLHFVIVYAAVKVRRLIVYCLAYAPAFLLSLWEAFLIPYQSVKMPWGWDYYYSGYFGYVELLWVILPTVAALLLLVRRYRNSKSDEEKIGVRYLFAGLFIPIVAGIISAFVPFFTYINIPDLAVPSAALGFLLVGYAVLRYGMYVLTPSAAADDILSAMADPLFLVNATGEIIISNRAASQVLEYRTSELTGKRLSALGPDSSFVKAMLADDSSKIFETDFKTRQGRTIPVSLSRSAITTKQGNLLGYVIICRDITERKRMERLVEEGMLKVRESEAKFRGLYDSIRDGIMANDVSGRIYDCNRAFENMVGYPLDELRKMRYQDITPEQYGELEERITREEMLERGFSGYVEKEYIRKDGTKVPVEVAASLVKGREGKPDMIWGVIRDITERKQMQQALLRSERLSTIGELAAMVGHDLRNPLQAMTNTLYLVKKLVMSQEAEDRKEAIGLLGALDDNIQYMDKIVSDLQDYARPAQGDLVETSLPDLVSAIVSSVRIPGNVEVTVNVGAGLSNVKLDPALLRRVLTNLILNAVQAMPEGGRLTITGSTGEESFTVRVQDTGVGIAPENLEKVFNPFFTTKAKGQGLGLSVCKRLIEAQGGSIDMSSEVGKGSTFTLKMPTNRATEAT